MTTKKNVLLTLMFLLTTIQVSAQDMNSTVNTMLDGWARPIYLAGMLIGLIAGLVRNYDNIAAKNDNETEWTVSLRSFDGRLWSGRFGCHQCHKDGSHGYKPECLIWNTK